MEKSWETLSDPVIHAGGSWALGRFGRLFPSGEDSVEEGESLLLIIAMIPYLFFQKKRIRSSKLLVSKLYLWECSTTVG